MHPIMRKKLRHFNREEYNCDMCCLKDHECEGNKEYCAVKYDSVEVIRHHKKDTEVVEQQPVEPVVEQPTVEKDVTKTIEPVVEPVVEKTTTEKDVTKPVVPSSLCGQGRCMECPRTLC